MNLLSTFEKTLTRIAAVSVCVAVVCGAAGLVSGLPIFKYIIAGSAFVALGCLCLFLVSIAFSKD